MTEELPVLPVGYRILVKQEVVEDKTASGIILHTSNELERQQAAHSRGIVMSLGEAAYDNKSSAWCKVGDRVMFPNYAGKKFRKSELQGAVAKDGEPYWHLMNDEDILGVVNV